MPWRARGSGLRSGLRSSRFLRAALTSGSLLAAATSQESMEPSSRPMPSRAAVASDQTAWKSRGVRRGGEAHGVGRADAGPTQRGSERHGGRSEERAGGGGRGHGGRRLPLPGAEVEHGEDILLGEARRQRVAVAEVAHRHLPRLVQAHRARVLVAQGRGDAREQRLLGGPQRALGGLARRGEGCGGGRRAVAGGGLQPGEGLRPRARAGIRRARRLSPGRLAPPQPVSWRRPAHPSSP